MLMHSARRATNRWRSSVSRVGRHARRIVHVLLHRIWTAFNGEEIGKCVQEIDGEVRDVNIASTTRHKRRRSRSSAVYYPGKMAVDSKQAAAFILKKRLLQLFATLSILSWIVLDLFVQHYAEQLVKLNTHAKVNSEQYHHLKAGAVNLILGSSFLALCSHLCGLIGASIESLFLLSGYVLAQLFGSSLVLIIVWGNSAFSWYWTCNALWDILLTITAYVLLRDLQHCKLLGQIDRLAGELE